MKQMILNFLQENGLLPMIIQNQILMQQMKLPVIEILKSNLCD